jgi:sugar lactone lactonase YvrE
MHPTDSAPARCLGRALGVACLVLAACGPDSVTEPPPPSPSFSAHATATLLTDQLEGGTGSTIGPAGDLYVADNLAGAIKRVDPRTGEVSTYASGFPLPPLPLGGLMDVAFIGNTAYALTTLVGPDVGGGSIGGIYRVDGPSNFTLIADLAGYSIANPPPTSFDVPSGVQFAIEPWRGGFLVSDGHHNRVLWVTLDGQVSDFAQFGNTVPTGLATRGHRLWTAMAGPVPHDPQDGRVVEFGAGAPGTAVAAGASLLLDVEVGPGNVLYVLAQGPWNGAAPGSPAIPDMGSLHRVLADGTLALIVDGLDRPTSFQLLRGDAYVVTLDGEVWRVEVGFQP